MVYFVPDELDVIAECASANYTAIQNTDLCYGSYSLILLQRLVI